MSLVALFRSLQAIVGRHEPTFARVRPTQPALAWHPTAAVLLDALSLHSSQSLGDRQDLVRAIAALYRTTHHPLWIALLLHAFRPMLLSLRARDRGSDGDRDSRVLVAFLQAIARTPLEGQPVFLALQRATARALYQAIRAQRVRAETVPLEEADQEGARFYVESSLYVGCFAREMATRLAANRDA